MNNTEFDILLVEDNPNDAEIALRALRKSSSPPLVLHLEDGSDALEFVFGTGRYAGRNIRLQPRVIFLDLKMPKVSGVEVLKQIKSHDSTRNIPVVVFTSSKESRDVTDCYQHGANSYVVKPVEYESFVETITGLEHYWIKRNLAYV